MRKAMQKKSLHLLLAVFVVLALASTVVAQQQNDRKPANNPLVRLLQTKGILTEEEAAAVSQAATSGESEQRLAKLLLSKGLITQEDYEQTVGASVLPVAADGTANARVVPAVLRVKDNSLETLAAGSAAAPQKPAGPQVIPAVAPIRVLQSEPAKREGLIPDIKFGPVRVKPYGFFKTSVVHDTSSPLGNDFPLPGFQGDTGPTTGDEFHIKARNFRIGANFEWVDPSPKLAVTGRLEFDFEGNFTRANNRNISSIRSSVPSIRLAWGRIDYAKSDKLTLFSLFGQDWTPFGSSTLPNLIEGTGLGIGFGTLYERAPQVRIGFNYNFGGSRNFRLQPEVAMVLPAFGNLPSDLGNQLGFGERQGVDSGRPEVQGRIVAQFQLDKAKGVAPAQLIVSAMRGERRAIVTKAAVPGPFKTAFPNGVEADSDRNGWTAEIQLPTRYATLIAKYWRGTDLRFFFAGQLFSNFNDTAGLFTTPPPPPPATQTPGVLTAASIDGSSTVAFGFTSTGIPRVAPQRPVRSEGGFVQLGLPLSRIFNADPAGRNAGWSLYLHYGIDQAKARDVRRLALPVAAGAGGNRQKSDLGAVNLQYKLNNWVTFAYEQSLYRTRAIAGPAGTACGGTTTSPTPTFPLFRGNCAREWHDLRSEFATIFTF